MELDYTKLEQIVRSVADSVSSNYPSYVTSDDTESALWLFIYGRKSSIGKLVEEDSEWESQIASTLRKVAFDHCAKEKASAEGYSVDDLFHYSVPRIRKLLEEAFDYEDWQSFGIRGDGQPKSKAQANMTGDLIAELSDIKLALNELPEDAYNLLIWQFKYGWSMERLGEQFGITPSAASNRSQRALKTLRKQLGRIGPTDGPQASDRRLVRSNSAARAALSHQYEG